MPSKRNDSGGFGSNSVEHWDTKIRPKHDYRVHSKTSIIHTGNDDHNTVGESARRSTGVRSRVLALNVLNGESIARRLLLRYGGPTYMEKIRNRIELVNSSSTAGCIYAGNWERG